MSAARPHMSEKEFRADLAERDTAVADCAAEIMARLHKPVEFASHARRHETIAMALVLAKPDEPGVVSWWASTDGDPENVKTFPKSIINIVHRECDGLFVIATMKGYVAIERHLAQARIPGLAKSVRWTEEQRAGWKRIQAKIQRVKESLQAKKPGYRKPYNKLPFGFTA